MRKHNPNTSRDLSSHPSATGARKRRRAPSEPSPPSRRTCPPPASKPSPAERAQALTGRAYISWSQVSTYQLCPKSYELKYVVRAKPDFVPSSLAFGSAFHDAVALVAAADLEGAPRPSLRTLASGVSDRLRTTAEPVRLGKAESLDSLDVLAERMLGAYLESPESRIAGTSICIEDVARGVVDDLIPPVEARVDLVYQRQDGALVVRDVKTSRSRWTPDKVAESAPQLHLYALLLNAELEGVGKVQGLEFLTVTKAAKPVVSLHQLAVHPGRGDANDGSDTHDGNDALLGQLRQVWRGISEGVFPARPGWPCKSCPFASKCPAAIKGEVASHE